MMVSFGNIYLRADTIIRIENTGTDNQQYPYGLNVATQDGKAFCAAYATQIQRQNAANGLLRAMEIADPVPVTKDQVEQIVWHELDKLRRDFRRVRKEAMEP